MTILAMLIRVVALTQAVIAPSISVATPAATVIVEHPAPATEVVLNNQEQEKWAAIVQWEDDNNIHTMNEYEDKYAGLCPSEQPRESVFWEHARFSAALGLDSPWPSPEYYTEIYWREYHVNPTDKVEHVSNFANLGLAQTEKNRSAGIFLDWSTWSFYWDATWQDNRPYTLHISPDYPAEWDEIATRMTAYLRQLEARYNILCPGE